VELQPGNKWNFSLKISGTSAWKQEELQPGSKWNFSLEASGISAWKFLRVFNQNLQQITTSSCLYFHSTPPPQSNLLILKISFSSTSLCSNKSDYHLHNVLKALKDTQHYANTSQTSQIKLLIRL
jgi:hypothetical protein